MLNAVRDKFERIQHLDFHVSEENQVDSIFINTICMYNNTYESMPSNFPDNLNINYNAKKVLNF
jgi:hypothetical protein